uniref:Uncharacterized protein n=1 Tax=Tanacetum cinerariifolium TaxID=118510 RepID=A0A6L2KB58_TANCI|nr:hypothetical protein [Tanacetum cinerariifolium]
MKIQSSATNGNSKDQQDSPARMCDGFQIGREPSDYQANSKRKNHGGNTSKISGTNNNDWFHTHRRRHIAKHRLSVPGRGDVLRLDRIKEEDVRRLQGAKQSMPKRRISAIENRLEGGIPYEKRRSNLPVSGGQSVSQTDWQKPQSVVSEQDVLSSSVELDFRALLNARFFGVEVTKLTTGRLVNGSSCDDIDVVIKILDLEPKDIVAKFCGPSRWKELSKELAVLHQLDGVESKRHHAVPFRELDGIPIALVAWSGVIS